MKIRIECTPKESYIAREMMLKFTNMRKFKDIKSCIKNANIEVNYDESENGFMTFDAVMNEDYVSKSIEALFNFCISVISNAKQYLGFLEMLNLTSGKSIFTRNGKEVPALKRFCEGIRVSGIDITFRGKAAEKDIDTVTDDIRNILDSIKPMVESKIAEIKEEE